MIHHGDLFDVLPTLPAESIDAVVTDPPYGIGFMGREWDTFKPGVLAAKTAKHPGTNQRLHRERAGSMHAGEYDLSALGMRKFQAWCEAWGREVFRVLKPGGYIVSCGAPRAYHRMTSGLEDAGFEIRDCLAWLFGSGFPKSLNIGGGLGTALKPAHEPIVLARKPFKGTVRNNVVTHGTGALNIDACRIPSFGESLDGGRVSSRAEAWDRPWKVDSDAVERARERGAVAVAKAEDLGRWPANVVLDDIASMVLDEQSGELGIPGNKHGNTRQHGGGSFGGGRIGPDNLYFDGGGASRFYYVAKPSREERDMGCYDLPARSAGEACSRKEGSSSLQSPRAGAGRTGGARNIHPTVKPVELMRWLVKLITPPGGTVLDPFTGSGTTGMACVYEQRQFIGIEREADYIAIAERRIAAVAPLFSETA